MSNGQFRKAKQKSFTMVSNYALRDKNLSLKAKGLYAQISYFLSIPDFTLYKDTLLNSSSDGATSFNSAFNELKKSGYLKVYKIQTSNGFVYEYELLDSPTDTKSTSGISDNGNSSEGEQGPILKNTQENNNQENKDCCNNNKESKVDTDSFASKIDEYKNSYMDAVRNDKEAVNSLQVSSKKLFNLFNVLPTDAARIVNSFSSDQAIALLQHSMDVYCPDSYMIQNRPPINNPNGYLIGYIRNVGKSLSTI